MTAVKLFQPHTRWNHIWRRTTRREVTIAAKSVHRMRRWRGRRSYSTLPLRLIFILLADRRLPTPIRCFSITTPTCCNFISWTETETTSNTRRLFWTTWRHRNQIHRWWSSTATTKQSKCRWQVRWKWILSGSTFQFLPTNLLSHQRRSRLLALHYPLPYQLMSTCQPIRTTSSAATSTATVRAMMIKLWRIWTICCWPMASRAKAKLWNP